MKTVIYILLFSFSSVTVTPISIMVLQAVNAKCVMECSMADENNCESNGMECCPGMCNPTQCCFCCFLCTMDAKKPAIKVFETNLKKRNTDSQLALSDYTSDCWQPPKML